MSEEIKIPRLGKAAKEFNVATSTVVGFLSKKGFTIEDNINTKLTADMYNLLMVEYQFEKNIKEEAQKLEIGTSLKHAVEETKAEEKIEKIQPEIKPIVSEEKPKKTDVVKEKVEKIVAEKEKKEDVVVLQESEFVLDESEPVVKNKITKLVGKVDLDSLNLKTRPTKKTKEEKEVLEVKEKAKKEKEKKPASKKLPIEKEEKKKVVEEKKSEKEEITIEEKVQIMEAQPKKEPEMIKTEIPNLKAPKVVGVLDLSSINSKTKPKKKTKEELRKEKETRIRLEKEQRKTKKGQEEERRKASSSTERSKGKTQEKESNFIKTTVEKLSGVKVVDKISIPEDRKESKSKSEAEKGKREKRKRIKTVASDGKYSSFGGSRDFHKKHKDGKKDAPKTEISGIEVDLQIKKTMARMAPTGKTKASKHRKEKRDLFQQNIEQVQERQAQEKNILKVTEYITANELATMMNIPVNKIIATCMSIGLVVAINQRLDAENIKLLAEEFGFQVQFVGIEEEEEKVEEISNPEDMEFRAPIVTIMGHVDHGKTSLLDYIRKTNVIAGEAGGITQHIGAYEVELPDKRRITFLDTPGHEAFTAMRARGAKVTDIVIVVIAADDSIMPQTVEAINHAQAAGVPIIFAINKIDKPGADPEKIRTALANMNLLVEEWGGKIQSQDISAKKGINVDVLMEKILIEAEMLELKANPKLHASGTIIESSLDKGRGYVAKALIQNGTLHKGDVVVAGTSFGKIKAMYNERNHLLASAGPSSPVLLLGLDSAPQAGDTFKVYENDKDAKTIVGKRQQLIREQGLRTQKHITLAEIGRRIAIGDFKELNIIVKGDVDGSIEALSDALLRLSTEEVQVNVIHKSVGQVTESDILLASASNAIIIAFQVRPSAGARKLAEQEQIDIRTYSIIYSAINDLKEAIEGMKAPEIKENIICNIEVREVFHISKVGVIAGCYVLDGKVQRSTQIRVIRDGIVIHTGRLGSLKRFKDDVKEVTANYECGLNIESYNDIKVGDIIEGFEQVEVRK